MAKRKGKFQYWDTGHATEPFRWRLRAANGRIVCQSEGYKTEQGCLRGIAAVKKWAPDADVTKL